MSGRPIARKRGSKLGLQEIDIGNNEQRATYNGLLNESVGDGDIRKAARAYPFMREEMKSYRRLTLDDCKVNFGEGQARDVVDGSVSRFANATIMCDGPTVTKRVTGD